LQNSHHDEYSVARCATTKGIFPLTLHDFADLAGIGSFLLTIALVYLAARPSSSETTTAQRGVKWRILLRRLGLILLAFAFGLVTIAIFLL
jgi:hypothetical protein